MADNRSSMFQRIFTASIGLPFNMAKKASLGMTINSQSSSATALADRLGPKGVAVFYPPLSLCTDNGAMIAYAGALRLQAGQRDMGDGEVRPRWPMTELRPPEAA